MHHLDKQPIAVYGRGAMRNGLMDESRFESIWLSFPFWIRLHSPAGTSGGMQGSTRSLPHLAEIVLNTGGTTVDDECSDDGSARGLELSMLTVGTLQEIWDAPIRSLFSIRATRSV